MEDKKLTRQQRRIQERVNDEAKNDPESEQVKDKELEIITKWKMYCGKFQLTEEAKSLMAKEIESIRKQYQETKTETDAHS